MPLNKPFLKDFKHMSKKHLIILSFIPGLLFPQFAIGDNVALAQENEETKTTDVFAETGLSSIENEKFYGNIQDDNFIEQVAATPIHAIAISDNPEKETFSKMVIVTAYSSTPDQTDSTPFTTASGTNVRDGVIASNFLKFGAKVQFPKLYGDKIFVVEDRMAPKNNHKMDIWFPDRQSAKQFGVKFTEVVILD